MWAVFVLFSNCCERICIITMLAIAKSGVVFRCLRHGVCTKFRLRNSSVGGSVPYSSNYQLPIVIDGFRPYFFNIFAPGRRETDLVLL
jgi:hypothetical protein